MVLEGKMNSSRLLSVFGCPRSLPLCYGFLAQRYENKVQIDARIPGSRPSIPMLQ